MWGTTVKLKIIALAIVVLVIAVGTTVIIQEQNQTVPTLTTPYYVYAESTHPLLPNLFYMDVDGTRYHNMSATFYWVVGTTHSITVPCEIKNQKNPNLPQGIQPESWKLELLGNSRSNTIQITVTNGTSTMLNDPNQLEIIYDANYNHNG